VIVLFLKLPFAVRVASLSSIVSDFNPEHPVNASSTIVLTFAGIVIDAKPEQLWNANSPIDVTELPIVTVAKDSHPLNQPLSLIDLPIYNDVIVLFLKLPFAVRVASLSSIVSDFNPEHPVNASTPILVTELPIVTVAKDSHPLNQPLSEIFLPRYNDVIVLFLKLPFAVRVASLSSIVSDFNPEQ
jgi:hypothetical protein